jgi:hypothetical protein
MTADSSQNGNGNNKWVLSILFVVVLTIGIAAALFYGQIDTFQERQKDRAERLNHRWRDPVAWKYRKENAGNTMI